MSRLHVASSMNLRIGNPANLELQRALDAKLYPPSILLDLSTQVWSVSEHSQGLRETSRSRPVRPRRSPNEFPSILSYRQLIHIHLGRHYTHIDSRARTRSTIVITLLGSNITFKLHILRSYHVWPVYRLHLD
ncbi:hypothetical protein WAI453_001353 [Rhynchosporium graminicola]